ncbi:MAG: urea carboxylase-associated family protein [Acidimicrobiia bacterium]|nr:urea carboxylase-associated family protein [Acidimicrobiia bacterium]
MAPTDGLDIVPATRGKGWLVAAGQRVAVVDVEGCQVVDLFAFCAADPTEHLSAGHTRVTRRRMFPGVGEAFVTDRRRPILTLLEDTSPGYHDMLVAACDRRRYELLGHPDHRNCADNLAEALSTLGVDLNLVPQPVNLFSRIPITPAGDLDFQPAATRPGDRIVFRAERDILLVGSSCPMDLNPISGGRPTAFGVEITDG